MEGLVLVLLINSLNILLEIRHHDDVSIVPVDFEVYVKPGISKEKVSISCKYFRYLQT